MKSTCKKLSALLLLIVYLLVLCPNVLAIDATTIDETALTAIPATSYVTEDSSLVEVDSTDSQRIIISSGGSVSYNVVAPRDGYYKLLVYGKYTGSKPTVTISGTPQEITYGVGVGATTDRKHTIGRFYLAAGEATITLSFTKEVNLKEILIKSVEHDIASSGENIIEAHDYLTSNISAYDREDNQSGYTATNTGVSVSGPVIVSDYEATSRLCTYKVNVAQAGLYRLKVYAYASKTATASYKLITDGTTISKATFVPTGTLTAITQCEAASFETFNLNAGEQKLSIRTSVSESHHYIYYYTLERIGEPVISGELGAQESTFEGENLFYSDAGVEVADGAIKIEPSTARADVNVLNKGLYAVTLRYKADEDTPVSLRFGSADEKYQTLAKTEGEYIEYIYQIAALESGLLRFLLDTEGTVYIDSVKFTPIAEADAITFVTAVNAADNSDELMSAFDSFNENTGLNYRNASRGLLYKTPLYARVLSEDYENIEEFSLRFADFINSEMLMKRLTINDGTSDILTLKSGNITMTLNTSYFAESNASVAAAIYEEGDFKKLVMVDIKDYAGEPEITFEFNNLVIDAGKDYSFKIIYFNDLETVAPKEMYKEIYKEIYVSQSGSDETGDGSKTSPFASIKKAVDYAKTFSTTQHGDVVVNVDSGTYTLLDTLSFDETNSGKNGFKLKIVGNKENPPIISGGKKVVDDWVSEGNGIYSAPISGVEYVRNLYINGYPAVRARSEERYRAGTIKRNVIPTTVYKNGSATGVYDFDPENSGFDLENVDEKLQAVGYDIENASNKIGFSVSKDYVSYNFNIEREDLELVWTYANSNNWEMRRTPVDKITETDKETTFILDPGLLKYIPSRFRNGDVFYFENAMELLDSPGEFYYNKEESRIYYMPHEGEDIENAEVYVGNLEQMVSIKGSSVGAKAENITFENLVFRYGAYDFASKYGYDGQQADAFQSNYRGEDGSEQQRAQIYVENAKGIEIKDCEISCMGSAGIHFKEGVNDSLIEGNMIRDLSGTGVIIGHPNHEDKQEGITVCDNISVANNVFRRNAAEYFNNTQISLYYEKNIDIVHNDIDMAPYSGITASWGWNGSNPYDCNNVDISYNKITNVMQLLNDGGAIYTVGKLKDSIISNNYINGSRGTVAGVMYQDSGSAYLEIFNNVILNANKSIYRNPNNDHDLNYYNNYSNIALYEGSIPEKNITVEAPIQVDADNLTGEALSIYNAAGVESAYSSLPAKDEFPSWRRTRIALPPYTNPDVTTVTASEFIPSESSSGLTIEKTYNTTSVTVNAGEYITFPIDVEKTGTYKVLINGKRISSSKPNISVADYTMVSSGLGVQTTSTRNYTIGRYTLTEGSDKIKFSVSNAGGIVINSIIIKNVDHEILPGVTNVVEMHDYYSANITSYDHEDNQSSYESTNCDIMVTGPIIAGAGSTRTLTYKANIKEAGTYRMNVYYAGGAGVAYSVLVNGEEVATKSANGTGNSDPHKCNKVVIDNVTLPSGDITLGLNYTASGSGYVFAYYYELEKVN